MKNPSYQESMGHDKIERLNNDIQNSGDAKKDDFHYDVEIGGVNRKEVAECSTPKNK
jgi:hypothetical protein